MEDDTRNVDEQAIRIKEQKKKILTLKLAVFARGNNVLEVAFDGMVALIGQDKYNDGVAGRYFFGLNIASFIGSPKQSPRYQIQVFENEFIKVRTAMQMPDQDVAVAQCAGVSDNFFYLARTFSIDTHMHLHTHCASLVSRP